MQSTIQKFAILLVFVSLFTTTDICAQVDIPPPDKEDDMALVGDSYSATQKILILNQEQQVIAVFNSTLDLTDPRLIEGLSSGVYVVRTEREELILRKQH